MRPGMRPGMGPSRDLVPPKGRDEAAYACRSLMRDGKRLVPEDQRPAITTVPNSGASSEISDMLTGLHRSRGVKVYAGSFASGRQRKRFVMDFGTQGLCVELQKTNGKARRVTGRSA